MLYLLKQDAITSKQAKSQSYKNILEDKIKSKSSEKLTNDIVFENLMDKTRRNIVDYKQLADIRVNKKRRKILKVKKDGK